MKYKMKNTTTTTASRQQQQQLDVMCCLASLYKIYVCYIAQRNIYEIIMLLAVQFILHMLVECMVRCTRKYIVSLYTFCYMFTV